MASVLRRAWIWLMGEPAVDDRGRRVKLVFVGGYPARLWTRISHMPVDVHRELREHLKRCSGSLIVPMLVMSMLLFSGWFAVFLLLGDWLRAFLQAANNPSVAWILVVAVSAVTVPIPFVLWYQRRMWTFLIKGAVRLGHCPSCGYALKNLAVAADGCSTCPECGAAWRSRR